MKPKELKRLETERRRIMESITKEEQTITNARNTKKELIIELNQIKSQIDKLEGGDIPTVVTEHAILRYLQRVRGMDLEEIEQLILPDHVQDQIKKLGNGKYPIAPGIMIVVANNKVVTVYDK